MLDKNLIFVLRHCTYPWLVCSRQKAVVINKNDCDAVAEPRRLTVGHCGNIIEANAKREELILDKTELT
ncbi:MAG: hypothetical protein ACREOZ_03905 [Gloeomargaritales cyanobacterium]